MARRRDKQAERIVARRRIRHLLETARRRLLEGERAYAARAVALARRIAMRYQTGLLPHERDRVCRECGTILVPGRTARVRLRAGAKRVTCLECGRVMRRGYGREQRRRRRSRAAARIEGESGEGEATTGPAVVQAKAGGVRR